MRVRGRDLPLWGRLALVLVSWCAVQAWQPSPEAVAFDVGGSLRFPGRPLAELASAIASPWLERATAWRNDARPLLAHLEPAWRADLAATLAACDGPKSYRIVAVHSSSSDDAFIWPVNGAITSTYGIRRHPVTHRRSFHAAVDIRARTGQPVAAPQSGTIVEVARAGAIGRVVKLRSGETEFTFGHLSSFRCHLGQSVRRGETIGLVGMSGRSTGPHLHFAMEIRGRIVNPLVYLGRHS